MKGLKTIPMASNQVSSENSSAEKSPGDKPPAFCSGPTVNLILENPSPVLKILPEIVERTIQDPIEFVVCDPGVMRFLNYKWRKINRPTDVLTFDLAEDDLSVPEGIVYIDGRMAPPLREVLERLYHGWLHLNGRTHDT
ncbi:MAG: hypothetical protein GY852_08605, partial [bacterium]|nr:hypothetical protein [bacterium]